MSGNGIGAEGAKPLADALRANGALTRLDVSVNKMTSEGVKLLREAVGGRANFELIDRINN